MQNSHFRSYKFFKLTLVLYFAVFLIAISLSPLAGEDDLFWYLSTGRYIVQNGVVPSADVFGFTTTGMLWIPFEWLWDIINYSLVTSGGYIALSVLSSLLILLIFVLLYIMISKFNVSYVLSLILLLLLSLGILSRLSIKPHLISYLCFALILTIIVNYRYFKRGNNRILYFLPLIFLIWANMHMGVMAGFLILGIFLLSEITGFISKGKPVVQLIKPVTKKQLLQLTLVSVISVLVTFINPHGIKTYEYAFYLFSLKHLGMINEWASPFSSPYLTQFYNFIYYLFIIGLIPVIYYSFKKTDIFPALLNVGFFLYSIRANRFTIDFMIISVLFLTVSVHFLLEKLRNTKFYSAFNDGITAKVVFSLLLLFLIISAMNNNIYVWTGYPRKFGFGIDPGNFPVRMYDFMKANKITEYGTRPFNTYETGGYFIWNFPDKKNFIGSRSIDDKVWNDYTSIINMEPGFESKIDSINFDYFAWMVPLIDYSQAPSLLDYGVLSYLFRRTDKWRLIYWDDRSFLFVKNTPYFDEAVMRYEYRYINPFNFYYQKDLIEKGIAEEKESVVRELSRIQKEYPNGTFQKLMTSAYWNRLE